MNGIKKLLIFEFRQYVSKTFDTVELRWTDVETFRTTLFSFLCRFDRCSC